MTDLVPVAENTPVPQLEKNDRATGGPGGNINAPAQALANQIEYLRKNDIASLAKGQASDLVYYATLALLQADLTKADGARATVDRDPTLANNGAYFYTSATQTWAPTVDRVAALDARASAMESGDFSAKSNFKFLPLAPDSGYAWALVDANGRSAILVSVDGTVYLPKYAKDAYIPQTLNPDSGYLWALTDEAGRIGLAVKTDGTVVGKLPAQAAPAGAQYLQPTNNLWCLGDSLTAGAGGQTTWRQRLIADYPARVITNWAVGGQTSTQIAARAGAYVALLTVAGNQIPAAGPVVVAARSISLLTSQGSQSITGWLSGIYGTLTRSGDDSYAFTRQAAGVATYCAPNSPFVPDVSGHDFDTLIVFLGRNNLTLPGDIQRDIGLCIGAQKTAEKRFLIITPPNGGSITAGVPTDEGTGSSNLVSIQQIEAWAVQTYGDRVLKVREYSYQFNNGSADDLDDVAKETVPRSLRIDSVHWTTYFHGKVADWIENEINRRGW